MSKKQENFWKIALEFYSIEIRKLQMKYRFVRSLKLMEFKLKIPIELTQVGNLNFMRKVLMNIGDQ